MSAEEPAQTGNLHRADLKPSTAEVVGFQFLRSPKQDFEKSHSSAKALSLFHLHLIYYVLLIYEAQELLPDTVCGKRYAGKTVRENHLLPGLFQVGVLFAFHWK